MKIAWGLLDTHVQVWYRGDRDAINTAGFTACMVSVSKHWLPAGWEHNMKCLILSSLQGNSPVADWIRLLESTNAVLVSTTSHLETANFCNHIETHLHPDTQIAAHLAKMHLILDYATYVRAIKLIDNAHIRQAALLQEAVSHMYVPANLSRRDRTPHTATTNTSPTTATADNVGNHLPAFTALERTLLQNNEGCFKCQVPFAKHFSCNCPTGFPDKANYKPLTESDIVIVKKRKANGKATNAAAVLPVEEPPVPAAVVMPSAVLGEGSDSKYMDTPFLSPHFFVDVIIGDSSSVSQSDVCALIDHGCDSVLISLDLVDRLKLPRHKLPKPKSVVMAVKGDEKKEIVFREFVQMTVISSDQIWSSRSCRAIIAPNLCAPLILDNVFLAYNHFVIDHELRTCIDKVMGYDLLNPPTITRTVIKPKPRFGPELKKTQKAVIMDIKSLFPQTLTSLNKAAQKHVACPIAAI